MFKYLFSVGAFDVQIKSKFSTHILLKVKLMTNYCVSNQCEENISVITDIYMFVYRHQDIKQSRFTLQLIKRLLSKLYINVHGILNLHNVMFVLQSFT